MHEAASEDAASQSNEICDARLLPGDAIRRYWRSALTGTKVYPMPWMPSMICWSALMS